MDNHRDAREPRAMSAGRSPPPQTAPPSRRKRWLAVAAVVVVVAWALTLVGLRASATRRQEVWKNEVLVHAIVAAHARSIASGEQVTLLRGGTVVRLPGYLVRRGTDVVRVPYVIDAPRTAALMPGGSWAIGASGEFFNVSSFAAVAQCPRRNCVWTPAEERRHGRVVQITNGVVRMEDGAVAYIEPWQGDTGYVSPARSYAIDLAYQGRLVELHRDGTVVRHPTYGLYAEAGVSLRLPVPEPEEVVNRADLICVRGRRGDVRCARVTVPEHEWQGPAVLTEIEGSLARVAQVALGPDGLCVVDFDGRLSCASLPRPGTGSVSPFALSPVEGIGAVTSVALGTGVTCAHLRTGEQRCWGDLLDRGGIVRRQAPVAIAGLDAVERLVSVRRRLCALRRGEVLCWGAWWSHPSAQRPAGAAVQRVPTEGAVTDLAASWQNLCVVLADGRVRCTDGDPDVLTWRDPEGVVPDDVRDFALMRQPSDRLAPVPFNEVPSPDEEALISGARSGCMLGEDGHVGCRWIEGSEVPDIERVTVGEDDEERYASVPGLSDAVEIALTPTGLACARRATGQVVCWGRDVDGILTAADHRERGRRYRLDELLGRVAR